MATILWSNEGPTRVSCADAFSCGGSTDHIVRDVPALCAEAAPSVAAIALRCHRQVDLLQGWRLVAFGFEFAPSGCSSKYSCICGCSVRWQTGGGDLFVEFDWLGKAEDGVVVVNCWPVPVRMVDDLSHINPVVHAVRDAVLSEKNADAGSGIVFLDKAPCLSIRRDFGSWLLIPTQPIITNTETVKQYSRSFCFELKVLNKSKYSMPWEHCAFGNVSATSLRFFPLQIQLDFVVYIGAMLSGHSPN